MSTRLKMIRVATLAVVVLFGAAAGAHAATINVVPTSASSVDVVVNGLAPNEYLGAFDFDLSFDASLNPAAITVDPALVFFEGTTGFELVTPGVNMFTVNAALDTDCQPGGSVFPACVAGQVGTNWTLATVTFSGTGDARVTVPGLSNDDLFIETVPEPASLSLLAAGFAAVFARRRRTV